MAAELRCTQAENVRRCESAALRNRAHSAECLRARTRARSVQSAASAWRCRVVRSSTRTLARGRDPMRLRQSAVTSVVHAGEERLASQQGQHGRIVGVPHARPGDARDRAGRKKWAPTSQVGALRRSYWLVDGPRRPVGQTRQWARVRSSALPARNSITMGSWPEPIRSDRRSCGSRDHASALAATDRGCAGTAYRDPRDTRFGIVAAFSGVGEGAKNDAQGGQGLRVGVRPARGGTGRWRRCGSGSRPSA